MTPRYRELSERKREKIGLPYANSEATGPLVDQS